MSVMSAETSAVVSAFAAARPELATADGSFDACYQVSRDLMDALHDEGIEAGLVQLQGPILDMSRAHKRWLTLSTTEHLHHYVVCVEGVLVDLTASQFDRDAPAVLETPVERVSDAWRKLYVIDEPAPRKGAGR